MTKFLYSIDGAPYVFESFFKWSLEKDIDSIIDTILRTELALSPSGTYEIQFYNHKQVIMTFKIIKSLEYKIMRV